MGASDKISTHQMRFEFERVLRAVKAALLLINPEDTLLHAAKAMIRRQADQGYSFVDCISLCLMKERRIKEAFSTDTHFRKAGFSAVLA